MNERNKLELERSCSENELESFSERLELAIGSKSVRSIAALCSISDTVLRKYINEESTPNIERLVAIADTLGVTVEWLATGRGAKTYLEAENSVWSKSFWDEKPLNSNVSNEYAYINLYDAEVSMGSGAWNDDDRVIYPLAFRKDWLSVEGIDSANCAAIVARGDSMEETIKDGATLLVDLTSNSIGRDGVYVIRFDGHLLAKRLQRSFDGSVLIKSDNPAYSEIKVPKEQAEELHVIGRVVWFASVV